MLKDNFFIPFAIALLFLSGTVPAQVPDTGERDRLEEKARELVTLMSSSDFEQVWADFDSTMKGTLPPKKLEETWKALVQQVGQFKGQGSVESQKTGQYNAMVVNCEFENMAIGIKVVYNRRGKIAGLFFAPAVEDSQSQSPPYADPGAFRKTEVTIGKGAWSLPGMLTIPWSKRPVPAVILVHGSGPNDRDETIGPNKPFRDLAEGLSSREIAVLRYDKRTMKYGEQMMKSLDSLTVKEEVIDDVLAAVDLLRSTPGVDASRIFVLGHSLGGTLIPRIAEADRGIAGFIIMAGMARPLEDAILDQYTYIYSLDGSLSNMEKAELDTLKEQIARVKSRELSPKIPKANLPLGLPAKYWLDLRGYHPAEMAKSIDRPMLIMQGGRDYQVNQTDFDLWKTSLEGMKNVEMKYYPDLNHLFMAGQGKSSPQEYSQPGHVAVLVIEDIAAWVKNH